jgi:hypothetical protein
VITDLQSNDRHLDSERLVHAGSANPIASRGKSWSSAYHPASFRCQWPRGSKRSTKTASGRTIRKGSNLPHRGKRPDPRPLELIWRRGPLGSEPWPVLRLLGKRKTASIRLAVMDIWKPFRNATATRAPQAAMLFDKFHIMRHLGEALDKVRQAEYRRLRGQDRRYTEGQKYTLLSHRENLTMEGRRSLKTLLPANKRLNSVYLLKESFGQLRDYERKGWARRFFESWRASLKWQRLEPYQKFADMVDRILPCSLIHPEFTYSMF